ncbi:hypothetical protein J1605_006554 [Eschrichtius robustus]|uniref:Uncharacterized protein n=1 Tax=Eschrichtius robustus TaxID=9764 RepID=A0AB34H605_ESCRO|nr:hypothetical protein J1605_006554 [Eschrichtius robustus]
MPRPCPPVEDLESVTHSGLEYTDSVDELTPFRGPKETQSLSAFKEKRWLQQLGIARVLAKKSISNLTTQGGLTACENPPEILL